MATRRVDAFLLGREWRDTDDGVEIVLWGRSEGAPVRVRVGGQEAVMFVPRRVVTHAGRRAERPLVTLEGEPVDAVYFRAQKRLVEERDRLREAGEVVLESDVKPSDRYLMERFVTGAMLVEGTARDRGGILWFDDARVRRGEARPRLTLAAIDIETEAFPPSEAAHRIGGPLLSAAIACGAHERVFVRGEGKDRGFIRFVPDERTLLRKLFAEIVALDPDVLCGWNVVDFDLAVLEERARALGVAFAIGRAGGWARVLPGSSTGAGSRRAAFVRVPGRAVLDGIAMLKSATYSFERFGLGHVANELLGRGKAIATTADPVAEIMRMHGEDVDALATYNLEDCRLVLEIFAKTDLLGFAMERARLTGLPIDRQGGSVAAFDHLYLPRLHRRGVVAPDVGALADVMPSPGGHVLDSVPGLYRDVFSFDFRSLYPSIIRTFQIDPLGLFQPGDDPVPGEDGATFARTGAILPSLITTLHDARSLAMAANDAALSRAIKILMNSFYGVLGTPGCRFFDPRLPTSITRRGHAIIERARAFFEGEALPVVYGDTDSIFVHAEGVPEARGRELATTLTRVLAEEIARDFRVESHLELRFESHYERFLMPTLRGTERGSKKRYAGVVRNPDGTTRLVLRGLEAVRRDWTPLARRVQTELLRRVFADEPFEDWLRAVVAELERGELDHELPVRRRDDDDELVEIVMTHAGAQPAAARTSPIDVAHYVEKQLAPVCDVVLPFVGTSFERVAGRQTNLF